MFAPVTLLRLYPLPTARIAGIVTDPAGRPLSRRVILYNAARVKLAETDSDADGRAEFTVEGANGHDRFIAHAVGRELECDDISCPLRAEAI